MMRCAMKKSETTQFTFSLSKNELYMLENLAMAKRKSKQFILRSLIRAEARDLYAAIHAAVGATAESGVDIDNA